MVKRISSTTAARRFREVLDAVEHTNETFHVARHGRPVAVISPAGPGGAGRPKTVTWDEALATLRAGPAADDGFAADLEEIRRPAGPLPVDPWASS